MKREKIRRRGGLAARAALTVALALAMALAPALPPADGACQMGCARFAADDVTTQFDPTDVSKVDNYQFKNECFFFFNSNKSDPNKKTDHVTTPNQWRKCDKDVTCDPKTQLFESKLYLWPGEGASAKNPKAYTDCKCFTACEKKS